MPKETHQKNADQDEQSQIKKTDNTVKQIGRRSTPIDLPDGFISSTGDVAIQTQAAQLSDSRIPIVQRQKAAAQISRVRGNQYLQSVMLQVGQNTLDASNRASTLQRNDDTPPGYGICTEFGDYWVVPDDTIQSYMVETEQITESEFAALQATWDTLKSGAGNIKITEKDKTGTEHAGFKDQILAHFGKLLSEPIGRKVVMNLMKKTSVVTIRPSSAQIYGGANAIRGSSESLEKPGGKAGKGSGTIIQIDPNLKDDDIVVLDKKGKEIADPVFIILGHELIHAQHNAEGRNRRKLDAQHAAYANREEEETVATGSVTENDLRAEHGYKARHGSGGRDTR